MHALVGNDENLSKELAESRDKNIAVLNNSGLGHLQPEHMQTAVKLGASLLGEENLTNLFNHYGINTVKDKDLDAAANMILHKKKIIMNQQKILVKMLKTKNY